VSSKAALVLLPAALAWHSLAHADACADLPTPIYVTGSTAATPFLAEISKLLVNQTPAVNIVYTAQGSCAGVDSILNGTPVVASAASPASYWDSRGTEQYCDLPSAGVTADLAISDVFASTCLQLPNGLPSTIGDFLGPVQTMTFVVPKTSKQLSISAEAAYYVYGFGADSGVAPWTEDHFIFQRSSDSGTEAMIAAAIGVPLAHWRGTPTATSSEILQRVASATNPEATIGILSTSEAQDSLATLNLLAYQHFGQSCGYYPDSLPTANDKRNVRDGHYPIWGPLHLLYKIDNAGNPIDPQKRKVQLDVLGYLTGSQALPNGVSLFDVYAQNGLIPECAMRVSRTQDGGNVRSFQPENPCGCLFEARATGSSDCAPCTVQAQCPGGKACSFGYCED